MAESALTIIMNWKRKSLELSNQRKDALFTAATIGFEAMEVMINKESDQEDIQRVLAYLNVEGTLSVQFEKFKDDSTRDIMHGLLQSLQLTLSELAKERNDFLEMLTHANECNATIPRFPMEAVENAIDVSHANIDANQTNPLDFGEDEFKVNEEIKDDDDATFPFNFGDEIQEEIKEEILDDNVKVEMDNIENKIDNPFIGEISLIGTGPAEADMQTPVLTKNDRLLNDKISDVSDHTLGEDNSLNDTNSMAVALLKENKDPSNSVADDLKKLEYAETSDDSDDEYVPPTKRSKSESTVRKNNKRRSMQSGSVSKESKGPKKSDTAMECQECEYQTHSAGSFIIHLRKDHSTTPNLAGLALRCECGNESLSQSHRLSCDIANFTVIRKKDGPIRRLEDRKITPQCVLCEKRPKTACGYAHHLASVHNSSLKANGIYLSCACGDKFTCNDCKSFVKHNKKCDALDFSVHKLGEE